MRRRGRAAERSWVRIAYRRWTLGPDRSRGERVGADARRVGRVRCALRRLRPSGRTDRLLDGAWRRLHKPEREPARIGAQRERHERAPPDDGRSVRARSTAVEVAMNDEGPTPAEARKGTDRSDA